MAPMGIKRASLGYTTAIHEDLVNLPAPREQVVVAVYKFRDQTGQYKTVDMGSSWSTAVTQGATSMLLKALEDTGWFVVVEREGLSNLLNERKIIRSTRENYTGANGEALPPLPPLMYAGVTLEGGIISYETNTVTGGFGARYLGMGGHTEFRQDQVTLYLRAVATKSGRVLNNVTTTKSILSKVVDVGVYRFVREDRLLEIETGLSTNEPPQMCVLEAIEKAVMGLVIEGILQGNWELQNPDDINSPVIQAYLQERQNRSHYAKLDARASKAFYSQPQYAYNRGFSFGLNFGQQQYAGDFASPTLQSGGSGFVRYGILPYLSVGLNAGLGQLATRQQFAADIYNAAVELQATPWPAKRFRPYAVGQGGALGFETSFHNLKNQPSSSRGILPFMGAGLGLEYFILNHVSLNVSGHYYHTFSDKLDGMEYGKYQDYFYGVRCGVTLY